MSKASASVDSTKIDIYHITDLSNLPNILAEGGLHADAVMAKRDPTVIGHNHIKQRRLTEIQVPCCSNRFVGEFVPFYFCPRSPMLYTINRGATGLTPGCQSSIVHLVSTLAAAIATGKDWAVSSGNAGAYHSTFDNRLSAVGSLDWTAIRADQWQGIQHQKQAELLVADFFPFAEIRAIGCYDATAEAQVNKILVKSKHKPLVKVRHGWYY